MRAGRKDSGNLVDEFKTELEKALYDFNLAALSAAQMSRLVLHYQMLLAWNRHTNLTRIIKPKEAARLHYAESVFGSQFLRGGRTVLDIGSGAGFPAVPLAVVQEDTEVTALEANQKKSLFLYEVKDALRLNNFKVARERVENFDFSQFDLLTSRALDNAEATMLGILPRLRQTQGLMLYGSSEMIGRLNQQTAGRFQIESHHIPLSQSRFVAIFSFRQAL